MEGIYEHAEIETAIDGRTGSAKGKAPQQGPRRLGGESRAGNVAEDRRTYKKN